MMRDPWLMQSANLLLDVVTHFGYAFEDDLATNVICCLPASMSFRLVIV
jgi:hypothetical protein